MLPDFWHLLDMRLQSQMNVTLPIPSSGCHHDSDETANTIYGRRAQKQSVRLLPSCLSVQDATIIMTKYTCIQPYIYLHTYVYVRTYNTQIYTPIHTHSHCHTRTHTDRGSRWQKRRAFCLLTQVQEMISATSYPNQGLTHSRADRLVHEDPSLGSAPLEALSRELDGRPAATAPAPSR